MSAEIKGYFGRFFVEIKGFLWKCELSEGGLLVAGGWVCGTRCGVDFPAEEIASIEEYMENNTIPANAILPMFERITFSYQKIQWVWTVGALTAMDDWLSPVT
jgi:type VI secretion system secreted protein Hcp